jgi:hypothetical protein
MTTSEARDVIGAAHIHNDKLRVLEHIKRYLTDSQTRDGVFNILSCFPFEDQKSKAMRILDTVRSDVFDKLASGGHQGYAALGGLYTQSRPLDPHLYGSVAEQWRERPGHGKIEVPVTARTGVIPSLYTAHPSYAPPPAKDYATDRNYPTNIMYTDHSCEQSTNPADWPGKPMLDNLYPAGAPPLQMHQGGPHPTGFEQ